MDKKDILALRIDRDQADALEMQVLEADVVSQTQRQLDEHYTTSIVEVRDRLLRLGVEEKIIDDIVIAQFVEEARPLNEAAAYASALVQTQAAQVQQLEHSMISLYGILAPLGESTLRYDDPSPLFGRKEASASFEVTHFGLSIEYKTLPDTNEHFGIYIEKPWDAPYFTNLLRGILGLAKIAPQPILHGIRYNSHTLFGKRSLGSGMRACYIPAHSFVHELRENAHNEKYRAFAQKISEIPHMARDALKERNVYVESLGLQDIIKK